MKQIIVLIATILLGITIAGFVTDFSQSAESISDNANDRILDMTTAGGVQ